MLDAHLGFKYASVFFELRQLRVANREHMLLEMGFQKFFKISRGRGRVGGEVYLTVKGNLKIILLLYINEN